MIDSTFYNFTDPKPERIDPERISDLLAAKEGVLWVEIKGSSDEEIDLLKSEFHVHPLAIEDIRQREQRPKIVEYGDYIFFVVHELHSTQDEADSKEPCVKRGAELHLLVGFNFFVCIHDGTSQLLEDTRKRWEGSLEQQKLGPYYLLYLLLDAVTDSYFPAIDSFDRRVEDLEDKITDPKLQESRRQKSADGSELAELIALRHNLIMMRRSVTPLRDAVNVLLRRVDSIQEKPPSDDTVGLERSSRARTLFAYFQDVYDHAIRIVDSVDTYRDILSGLVDANLSVVSNRTNDIMKVLTSVSIILMSISVVTGWYGMNFVLIPELHWKYGYLYAVAVIFIVCAIEFRYFRGRHWL